MTSALMELPVKAEDLEAQLQVGYIWFRISSSLFSRKFGSDATFCISSGETDSKRVAVTSNTNPSWDGTLE